MTQFHVTNSQVAHLWAHQSQEWAQGNGALSFRDKSICSYSAEIGRLHSRKRGRETLALMATCQWSVTTSRHQSIVNGACYNVHRTVRVPHLSGLGGDHTRNRRYFAEEIASARKKLKRARTYALLHVRDIERVAGDASAYSRHRGTTGARGQEGATSQ